MKRRNWLFVLLLGVASAARAATESGTSTATFLRLQQGARGIGMGGAFTAVASGADAVWWNPAGLGGSQLREGAFSHTQFIEDVTSEYAAFSHPMGKLGGYMGYSFTYFNIPGVDGYDINKNPTGSLSAYSYAGSVGYGAKLNREFSVGGNVKFIREVLGSDSGTGFAVDLGGQWRQGDFAAGAAVQNLGPRMSVGGSYDKLPVNFRGGVAYNILPNLIAALDGEKPNDAPFSYHVGGEYRPAGSLALRAGYQFLRGLGNGNSAGLSAGISLYRVLGGSEGGESGFFDVRPEEMVQQVKGGDGVLASLDYAFVSYGDFSSTHRISLALRF